MPDVVKEAIVVLANKAKTANTSPESQQYAQAALNLAHAAQVLKEVLKEVGKN